MTNTLSATPPSTLLALARAYPNVAPVSGNETPRPVPPVENASAIARERADNPGNFQPIQTVRQQVGTDGNGGAIHTRLPVQPSPGAPRDPNAALPDARMLSVAPAMNFAHDPIAQALAHYQRNAALLQTGQISAPAIVVDAKI